MIDGPEGSARGEESNHEHLRLDPFASDLSVSLTPALAELDIAIRDSVRSHGGVRACTAEMAAKYGDYPEIAVRRARWARRVVVTAYESKARRPAVVARPTVARPAVVARPAMWDTAPPSYQCVA